MFVGTFWLTFLAFETALNVAVANHFGALAAIWWVSVDLLGSPLEEVILDMVLCDVLASYTTRVSAESLQETTISIYSP